jgi:hypothetical protein
MSLQSTADGKKTSSVAMLGHMPTQAIKSAVQKWRCEKVDA